ncbi:MAG: zinc ribbon domain-containing protein [Chloroflexota bacterium]
MDPLAIVVGLVLLGAAVLFVLKPLRPGARLTPRMAGAGIRPGEAHTAALSALRDLDFDFRTDKVSEDDYPGLRADLVAKAAEYIQAETAEDDRIESLIRARKTAAAHTNPCPKCGKHVEVGGHFCPHCGTALGTACPSCSGIIKTGDLYCTSCGTKLESLTEVAA